MVKNILIIILGVVLLTKIPSVNFSQEVENSLPISNPHLEQLRFRFIDNAKLLLPDPYAGLLLGMVIGIKEEIPYNFNHVLKNTGVVHVVVVSGQNLTLLAGLILGLSPYIGRKKTIWISLFVVFLYVFLTGFQIPVIRAAIMFFTASLAKLYGREGDAIRLLILTALIMLIINPQWVISISFQLSFLATIGVVILSPEIIKHAKFVPNILKQDLCVTIAAQVMTAPLIAFYFNQFSTAGLGVNILILWTIPFIMIFGALSLLISLFSLKIATIIIFIPKILLYYFVAIVNIFNAPWASIYINTFSMLQLCGIYLLILGVYSYLSTKNVSKEDDESEDVGF